jgi:hypothetical protein
MQGRVRSPRSNQHHPLMIPHRIHLKLAPPLIFALGGNSKSPVLRSGLLYYSRVFQPLQRKVPNGWLLDRYAVLHSVKNRVPGCSSGIAR